MVQFQVGAYLGNILNMTTLSKITWQDFQRVIQIVKEYRVVVMESGADGFWFDEILNLFSKVKKQNYNIEVNGLKKEDLHKITVIVDMWNAVKSSDICYNKENDKISSKLQKAYFKNFQEHVWFD